MNSHEIFGEIKFSGSESFPKENWPSLYSSTGTLFVEKDIEFFVGKYIDRHVWDRYRPIFETILKWGGWIAGGSLERLLRGEAPNDLDVYFSSFDQLVSSLELLDEKAIIEEFSFKTGLDYGEADLDLQSHVSLEDVIKSLKIKECRFVEFKVQGVKVQFIKTYFGETLEDILDKFDLSVCLFGYSAETKKLTFSPKSLTDLEELKMDIHRLHYPVGTMRRILKYSERGYRIRPQAMIDMMKDVMSNPTGYFKTQ